ncbi:MAG: precorrin-2 C(20)-methyltransferase [Oscillospiraceae bacterium]|nr:precorrin-2 C(20)-methyltransferase [Oscillospiraceae bacterium]
MLAFSVAAQVVDMTGKTVVPLDLPMKPDRDEQRDCHRLCAELLAGYLGKGQDVAMLSIGDVSLYSSCTYIAKELTAMGYETRRCAGVPSFCAAAAELDIPLCEGSEPLTVIPAMNEDAYTDREGTVVILKNGGDLSAVKDSPLGKRTVYAAENCGLSDQKLYRLEDAASCGYLTVLIAK